MIRGQQGWQWQWHLLLYVRRDPELSAAVARARIRRLGCESGAAGWGKSFIEAWADLGVFPCILGNTQLFWYTLM